MPVPLYDPTQGPLRLVGLMSGSGTNLIRILEHQKRLEEKEGRSPFQVAVLFSDNWQSRASAIGRDFDIPVIIRDIESFCAHRNRKRNDLTLRPEFDREVVKALSPYKVKAGIFGGYMSIASPFLIQAFLGINVHPADLSIRSEEGERKFTGGHAVRDAIRAGETTIAASTHLIEEKVDGGRLLMISSPIPLLLKPEWDLSRAEDLGAAEAFNQERLKVAGDWVIFPKTVEYLARGRFGMDASGLLYFDDQPIPEGLRWREGLDLLPEERSSL